jgi:hypothetical protein
MDYQVEWVAHPKMESISNMQENSKIRQFKPLKNITNNKNKSINAFQDLPLSQPNKNVFNVLKN